VDNSKVAELKATWDDLAYLDQHGALAGVSEIIRERRRQIEKLGFTAERDDSYADMILTARALHEVHAVLHDVAEYSASPADAEDGLRKSGALAAAEIDRLNRAMTPEGKS
jgi:hypothetical protein